MFTNNDLKQHYEMDIDGVDTSRDENNQHLSAEEVLTAHYLIADFFLDLGEGIGGIGVKDKNLLLSALSRQNACFGGVCKYTGVFEIGATLLFGLIKNHPFYDANKRTAFLSILYFLQKNNFIPSVSELEFEDFLVEIADDKIQKRGRYVSLRKKSDTPEVDYIAWYLKKNTRKIDKQQYLVTYRELAKILRGFGFDLKDPSNGSINVVKYRNKILVMPFSKSNVTETKIGTISYPGEGKQVGRSVLKTVREITELTAKKGYDSQVFYKDVQPLSMLINKYEAPLRRLANR